MARLGVVSVALLCVCLAGHAEDSRGRPAQAFWPQPLSAPTLPLGPRDAESAAKREHVSQAPEQRARTEDAESREELAAAVAAQLDAIEAEQARDGERSPQLIGELSSLAFTYQKLGDYPSADAALQHAIEIARIDFGLHSLDQAEVVESLVSTRQTSGDYGGAAEKRRYLRELVGRNSNDPRVVGILAGMAAQEMENARRLVGLPAPSQIAVTSGGGDAEHLGRAAYAVAGRAARCAVRLYRRHPGCGQDAYGERRRRVRARGRAVGHRVLRVCASRDTRPGASAERVERKRRELRRGIRRSASPAGRSCGTKRIDSMSFQRSTPRAREGSHRASRLVLGVRLVRGR